MDTVNSYLSNQETINQDTINQKIINQETMNRQTIDSESVKQEIKRRLEFFKFFGLSSFIYALFYTFCLFRNPSGITFPFFVGGTLFYFCLFFKKLEITVKRDSAFCIISLILLGISTFLTDDRRIHFFNGVMILLLFGVFLLHQLYQDREWTLTKHVSAMLISFCGLLSCLFRPVQDACLFLKGTDWEKTEGNKKGRYVLFGLLLSVPFVFVILLLLGSADIVFGYLLSSIIEKIRLPENLIGAIMMTGFVFFAVYALLSFMVKRTIAEEVKDTRSFEPLLAITFTGVLSAVYVLFCGIQLLYLFGGQMKLPYGYTYAEYAREGFFQLLAVCIINLCLVLFCLTRFRSSKILKYLLTLISMCTYVMIFSSGFRMILYIQYYYLTFLRLLVLWTLVVLFFLITGILIQLYRPGFPLFRYSLTGVTVLYLMLSFSHPDYWIARLNLSQAEKMDTAVSEEDFYQNPYGYSDLDYITSLSMDAAPAILAPGCLSVFAERQGADYYLRYLMDIGNETDNLGIRSFNLSRFIARRLSGSL